MVELKSLFLCRVAGCGVTVSQNSTHIQNSAYPDAYTDASSCTYTFQKSSLDICYIRLQFVNLVLRGPDVQNSPYYTRCLYDSMAFTTPSAHAPSSICGYNSGQHLYMDSTISSLTSNPSMTITFTGSTYSRYWQIRVDQIPCGSSYTPPHGKTGSPSTEIISSLQAATSTSWRAPATSNPSTSA